MPSNPTKLRLIRTRKVVGLVLLLIIVAVLLLLVYLSYSSSSALFDMSVSEQKKFVQLNVADEQSMSVLASDVELQEILRNYRWRSKDLMVDKAGQWGLECAKNNQRVMAGSKVANFLLVDVSAGHEVVQNIENFAASNSWEKCNSVGGSKTGIRVYLNQNQERFLSVEYVVGNGDEAAVSVFISH